MVSTRQQSNISGGGDNSGSGSGSESSSSSGSSKSLRNHSTAQQSSNAASGISGGSGNAGACLIANSAPGGSSCNRELAAAPVSGMRPYVTTRQSIGTALASSGDTQPNMEMVVKSHRLNPSTTGASSSVPHIGVEASSSSISNSSRNPAPATRQQQNVGSPDYALPSYGADLPQHPPKLPQYPPKLSRLAPNVPIYGANNRSEGAYIFCRNGVPSAYTREVKGVHLLNLPMEILENIFSYVGYKNVALLRLACKYLDRVCGSILNSTFQKLQTQMLQRFQAIKAKMPRRESARRNHPLACESDIIETLHMRLTLLQMSFGKHIERKHCCFFAGEILDEVYRILHYIRVTPKLARPYKVTDELFDLSTMAMEYFKEHIEPTLPEIAYFGTDFLDFTGTLPTAGGSKYLCLDLANQVQAGNKSGDESPGHTSGQNSYERQQDNCSLPQTNIILRKRLRKIKQSMQKYTVQLQVMRREMRQYKGKLNEQQKQLHEYASRLDEHEKKNEETSRKFSTLLQELNKCKTELQYWRSKAPLNPMCVGCGKLTGPSNNDELGGIQTLSNQPPGGSSIMHAELAIGEEPCLDAGFPVTLPGTSTDEVWNTWSTATADQHVIEHNKAALAGSPALTTATNPVAACDIVEEKPPRTVVAAKRKASCDNKNVKATKKQRTSITVFNKFRSKRH